MTDWIGALADAGLAVGVRATDRLAAAHDASHYRMVPQGVAIAGSAGDVAEVFSVARRHGVAITLRSGGTSLSGQASGSGLVLDVRRGFRGIEVLDDGARVRCGAGATVRAVNARLARSSRRLGPDPASEVACTIGGVVANNSSGMSCGVVANSYRTIDSLVVVLPSGTVVDTSRPDADERLASAEPALHDGLNRIRDRIRSDARSVERIRELFAIKNTMGYGLNAFLDHDEPVRILEHLMVGSEGTLGFVAEATFRTVPLAGHAATGLLVFPELGEAALALPALVAAGFATIELLDAASLRVAAADPAAPAALRELPISRQAALLVEFQEQDAVGLDARIASALPLIGQLPLVLSPRLDRDPAARSALWRIRKGLYTAVAGNRPPGTTALLEDVAVPVAALVDACDGLIALFARHGYDDAVIFGHARDGNLHFMLVERFDDDAGVRRYEAFTEDLVDLVLRLGGTLKAEHGTGRAMAPFVHLQYGEKLSRIMWEIKELIDPTGFLGPGVVLTRDPHAHMRDLKTAPRVEEEVDRCVECGYCEPVCPSRDLTTTPRQRIALRREAARAVAEGDTVLAAQLAAEYGYDAVETCAVDGMCEMACPVLINTGDLMRRLRTGAASSPERAGWAIAAHGWQGVTRVGSSALTVAATLPAVAARGSRAARALLGDDRVPLYSGELPTGGRARRLLRDPEPAAILFSSCTTTMFGSAEGGAGVEAALVELCARAGVPLAAPPTVRGLCCGTPWKSKGMAAGYTTMATRTVAALREATRGGELPVVCDAASCTEGLRAMLAEEAIHVIDAVELVDTRVLGRLRIPRRLPTLALHPTCSSNRMGLDPAIRRVAAAVADEVIVSDDWGCCGFAGDRGMLHPELTASATRAEAADPAVVAAIAHASVNRTCELGMTRATGRQYRHLLELVAELSVDPAGVPL